MTRLSAVLWDLDGTLLDTGPLWRNAEYAFLGRRGLDWSDAHSERLVGGNLERVSDVFAEVTGMRFTIEQLLEELAGEVEAQLRLGIPWMPGARSLIDRFAAVGVRQGIVTSSHREIVEPVLAAMPALDVRITVTRDDVRVPKPDPEPYRRALELLAGDGVVEGVLAIEDSDSGLRAALGAGLPVLHCAPDAPARPAQPTVVAVASATDLAGPGLRTALTALGRELPQQI